MQQFHYVRELIGEGILHRKPGSARGIPLREVVRYPIPLGVNLLIYAGIADAVNDAHNNNMFHGDLSIDDIFLTDNAVLVNGFGVTRQRTRAPEGVPQGPKTDVYALGVILFSILSSNPDYYPAMDSGYEQNIVNDLIHLQWDELTEQAWLENIQTFYITTVHQNPFDRPEALDIANISLSLVEHCHDSNYARFATQLEQLLPAEDHFDEVLDTEELAGPSQVQGFDIFDDLSMVPDSVQGAATGLWSREAIAKIYQEENNAPSFPQKSPPKQSYSPPQNSFQNTQNSFQNTFTPQPTYTPQEEPPSFDNMPTEDGPMVQPRNFGFEDELSNPENFIEMNTPPPISPSSENHTFNFKNPLLDAQNQQTYQPPDMNQSTHPNQNIVSNSGIVQNSGIVSNSGIHNEHHYIEPNTDSHEFPREHTVEERPDFTTQPAKSSNKVLIIGGIVGLVLLLLAGSGIGLYFLWKDSPKEQETVATEPAKEPADEEPADEEPADEEPADEEPADEEPADEEPPPTKTKTKTKSSPATKTATPTKTATTTKTATRTKSNTSSGGVQKEIRVVLSITSSDDAIVKCKDGQTKTFSGSSQFTFKSPTKCYIEADGAKGLAKITSDGSIRCRVSGSSVICN